jgi:hypothetical protein
LEDTIVFIYFALIIFFIPLIMIVFIYFQIVKYMKSNPFSTTSRSTKAGQRRQQSELRLIRRILILVIILFVLGFPYSFFCLTIHFHILSPWPSMPRISYLFITFGQSTSMLINLMTTDDVRKYLINIIRKCCCQEVQVQQNRTSMSHDSDSSRPESHLVKGPELARTRKLDDGDSTI